jgi:leucyl aminopeptidase
VIPPIGDELQNGVTVAGITENAKAERVFTLNVPDNATNLNFITSGGSGDADLYVKFNSAPTLTSFDCKSTTSSSNESCEIGNAQAGVYYVMVQAWNAITNVSLTGSYNEGNTAEPINRVENNISVAANNWSRYTQNLDAGYSAFTVNISGGNGDADLYVNFASPSTESVYQCRPFKNGNLETCNIDNPQAGTWFIDLKGYSSASGVTLSITAQ